MDYLADYTYTLGSGTHFQGTDIYVPVNQSFHAGGLDAGGDDSYGYSILHFSSTFDQWELFLDQMGTQSDPNVVSIFPISQNRLGLALSALHYEYQMFFSYEYRRIIASWLDLPSGLLTPQWDESGAQVIGWGTPLPRFLDVSAQHSRVSMMEIRSGMQGDTKWIRQWDGSAWSNFELPTDSGNLISVWTSGPDEEWYANRDNRPTALLHRIGTEFSYESLPSPCDQNDYFLSRTQKVLPLILVQGIGHAWLNSRGDWICTEENEFPDDILRVDDAISQNFFYFTTENGLFQDHSGMLKQIPMPKGYSVDRLLKAFILN
jgi:hypothetical protein